MDACKHSDYWEFAIEKCNLMVKKLNLHEDKNAG